MYVQSAFSEVDTKDIRQVQHCGVGHWRGGVGLADVHVYYQLGQYQALSTDVNVCLLPLTTCSVPTESPVLATMDASPPIGHCCAPTLNAKLERSAKVVVVTNILNK